MRARFSFSVLALVGAMAVSPTAHAGDVVSKSSGGKLVLEGDDGANVLTIDQVGVPADSLRVTPGTGTTLDGAATPQVFAATTGGLKIVLGDQNDSVLIQGITLAGKLEIQGHGGVDAIVVDTSTTAGPVKVDLGVGPNAFTVCNAQLNGKVGVRGGFYDPFLPAVTSECPSIAGTYVITGSLVRFQDSLVAGDLAIEGADGIDTALLFGVDLAAKVRIAGGPGRAFAALCDVEVAKDAAIDFEVSAADGKFTLGCPFPGEGEATAASTTNTVALGRVDVGGKLVVSAGTGAVALCDVSTRKDLALKVASPATSADATCILPGGASLVQSTPAFGSAAVLFGFDVGGKVDAKFAATPTSIHRFAAVDASIAKTFQVSFGAGAGIVSTKAIAAQNLSVKGGGGNDDVSMAGSTFTKKGTIDLGEGNNTLTIGSTTFAGDLNVKTGDGNDTIDVAGATVLGKKTIKNGGGTDTVQQ